MNDQNFNKVSVCNCQKADDALTNRDTFIEIYKYTLKKANSKLLKTFLLGLAAGIFIGIAYIVAIYATRGWNSTWPIGIKSLIFGMVFTLAIFLILFIGGEMFTSNSMIFLSVVKRQTKIPRFIANLFIVLIGNFIGCFALAAFTFLSGYFDDKDFLNNLSSMIKHKLNRPWWKVFFSAILCNILVAGSVYIAHSTKSSSARFLLVFLVIMAFATSGFSHVVANSYVWASTLFIENSGINDFGKFSYQIQLPSLFGNFIGGGILLPGLFYLIFYKELPPKIIL